MFFLIETSWKIEIRPDWSAWLERIEAFWTGASAIWISELFSCDSMLSKWREREREDLGVFQWDAGAAWAQVIKLIGQAKLCNDKPGWPSEWIVSFLLLLLSERKVHWDICKPIHDWECRRLDRRREGLGVMELSVDVPGCWGFAKKVNDGQLMIKDP